MAPPRTRASFAPGQHVLVYDGGCPFCTAVARRLKGRARRPLQLMTFEEVTGTGMLTALSRTELEGAAHLITPEGIEYHGGEAVTRAVRLAPFGWLAAPLDWPPLTLLRDAGYSLVARVRPWLSRFIG